MSKVQRVSLTKSQRAGGIGAELLALCQAVTDDGHLTKAEIVELRRWLKDNRRADLPAIDFLNQTIERIIADGRITREERRELYSAIELVLPPDARKEAIEARREAESEREYRERLEQQPAPRPAARQPRPARAPRIPRPPRAKRPSPVVHPQGQPSSAPRPSAQEPLATSKFMVAGVHHQGRGAIVDQFADEGDQVFLARDPDNPLSPTTIEVRLANGYVIGFVPEEDAEVLAPLLDEGCPHMAIIKTIVTGGRAPVPVVVSSVYEGEEACEDAVYPEEIPARVEAGSSLLRAAWDSQLGWVLFVTLVAALGIGAYFLFR